MAVSSLLTAVTTSPGVRKVALATVALPTVAFLALAGCAEDVYSPEDGDDGEEVVGVAAEPSASPGAGEATGTVAGGEQMLGLVRAGLGSGDGDSDDSPVPVAALEQGRLSIGPLEDVASGDARSVEVDDDCTTVTGAVDGVVLGCGDTVRVMDASGGEVRTVDAPGEVTSAAMSPEGDIALTVADSDKVHWFDSEGSEQSSESMTATASGMHLVGNTRNADGDGDPQWRAALVDAEQSSLTDIDITDQSRVAALRAGQGVGTVSAGMEPDSVLVASDTRQDQALVYTVTDVIRHTQAVPTGPGPWAVLWDSSREVMWVSTTGDNRLTGYDLSSGTPEAIGDVPTAADVRHVIDDGSGDLLLVTEDGSRELITSDDLPRKG